MSKKHRGFTEEQLFVASKGAGAAQADSVKTRMENFASGVDGVPVTIQEDGSAKTTAAPPSNVLEMPHPSTRKVRATPKQLSRVLSGIPEKILEALKIVPDNEDKKALEESADFLQDIFGFDFEVDEKKTTIRSRWWAFLWVGGVIGLVYLKHKGAELFKALQVAEEPVAFPADKPEEEKL